MTTIQIGKTNSGNPVSLPLKYANRHGLVTGATGTGKSVTLQRLAHQFSAHGIPVFAADVKGDLSGIAAASERGPACPAALWDIFGRDGLPIRTNVHDMGALMLSAMLGLNETQSGALAIAFRKAEDEQSFLLTLDDLRWSLNNIAEMREEVCRQYGNVTGSSIAAIQRSILALEAQGGAHLFGEPQFAIEDFLRTDAVGRGFVNLLHADQLLEAPRLYATFLLWLLTELFRKLPEAGDLEKPKLIFFFDEAHLLFRDAPKPLLQQIERLARLVRSKGVGVYFVTQSPADVPDVILAQLGNRIQHALRAYTPKDQKMIRAAAQAFRPNPSLDVRAALTELAVGEALVSVMETDGVPSPVERVRVTLPESQIGPISELERQTIVEGSAHFRHYRVGLDDDEARRRFVDRMRERRGLPPIEWSKDSWKEGDYLEFVPTIGLEPDGAQEHAEAMRGHLRQALIAGVIALAGAWWLGLLPI